MGAVYDTDTATSIAGGDHGHDDSQAWWRLYQTPGGAFFEVAAGHDGVVEDFHPLTRKQAYDFLGTHANHLLEKYFGPFPDASTSRFSRRTIIAAVEVLDGFLSQAALTRLLLKFDSGLSRKCSSGSVAQRCNLLIQAFDGDQGQHVEDGQLLADALVEAAVGEIVADRKRPQWGDRYELPTVTAFEHALDRDGFVLEADALRRTLPAMMRLPKVDDQVFRLLDKHGFNVPKGHLQQALSNHTDGNWAAANSQIRSFVEGLLDDMAPRIDPSAAGTATVQGRRAKLAASDFLSKSLNEWGDNGVGYVNGLMARLHPHGSHPGLSDQDDSTFRLHTVLLTARLFLL